MTRGLVQFIAGAVTLVIIDLVVNSLNSRETVPDDPEGKQHYVMRMPQALKAVYTVMFWFGMLLFAAFLTAKLTVGGGVTNGHLIFAMVISGIGLLVVAISTKWHICVDGDRIMVYRLFHKTRAVLFSEMDKAVVGKKQEIALYKDGKKIVTVDVLSDNYDIFRKTLEEAGKLREEIK